MQICRVHRRLNSFILITTKSPQGTENNYVSQLIIVSIVQRYERNVIKKCVGCFVCHFYAFLIGLFVYAAKQHLLSLFRINFGFNSYSAQLYGPAGKLMLYRHFHVQTIYLIYTLLFHLVMIVTQHLSIMYCIGLHINMFVCCLMSFAIIINITGVQQETQSVVIYVINAFHFFRPTQQPSTFV